MIYVIDEKDLSVALKALPTETFEGEDSVYVFCKDMTKPSFTGEDVLNLLNLKNVNLQIQNVGTRDEQVFLIGGLVFNGGEVTLFNFSVPVPEYFKEKVHIMTSTVKKTAGRRGGRRKASEVQNTEDSSDMSDESDRNSVIEG